MRDWDSIVQLSKTERVNVRSKITGLRNHQLWELVEQSTPILIAEKIWRIRVLYQKVERRFYLDVREVTLESTEQMNYYLITDNGVLLPLSGWSKIVETIFKYMRKFK